jgi:hypothetical protein
MDIPKKEEDKKKKRKKEQKECVCVAFSERGLAVSLSLCRERIWS